MLSSRCLRFEDHLPFVPCVKQGVVAKRPVMLGYSDGSRSEIVEGLGTHDLVVIESPFSVHVGQTVRADSVR